MKTANNTPIMMQYYGTSLSSLNKHMDSADRGICFLLWGVLALILGKFCKELSGNDGKMMLIILCSSVSILIHFCCVVYRKNVIHSQLSHELGSFSVNQNSGTVMFQSPEECLSVFSTVQIVKKDGKTFAKGEPSPEFFQNVLRANVPDGQIMWHCSQLELTLPSKESTQPARSDEQPQ